MAQENVKCMRVHLTVVVRAWKESLQPLKVFWSTSPRINIDAVNNIVLRYGTINVFEKMT